MVYVLQKSANPPKYPSLGTLNEIIIDDSNPTDDEVNRNKQLNPGKDSIDSFRMVHSDFALVGH